MRQIQPLLLLSFLILPVSPLLGNAFAQGKYTLQVASFSESASAHSFAANLSRGGISAICANVELPGRGIWTRVFVGSFTSRQTARTFGEHLVNHGIVAEFLVTQVPGLELMATRPRRTKEAPAKRSPSKAIPAGVTGYQTRLVTSSSISNGATAYDRRGSNRLRERPTTITPPLFRSRVQSLLNANPTLHDPRLSYTGPMPTPDPVRAALNIVLGRYPVDDSSNSGGLWLSGDIGEGLARLRWIAGADGAELLIVDDDGRVRVDISRLVRVGGGAKGSPARSVLSIANSIFSNEGLLLLVELTEASNRYLLHLGRTAPTAGLPAKVAGSLNMDNNFDSRINPYRKSSAKLAGERPPKGFASIVALNPAARWFNLETSRLVPVGHITFHELAEAYAKVELGLDYLVQSSLPGAHDLALEREKLLKLQRPRSEVVLTLGSNRVLRSEEELRQFYSVTGNVQSNSAVRSLR